MYKSCNLIQHGLCFFNDTLTSCCFSPVDKVDGQVPPMIKFNYWGEIIPVKELFMRMDKYADIFKAGGCPRECQNCYKIEEKDWPEERYIDQITITHFSMCNADCIYCSNNYEKWERTPKTYDILPVLNYFKEQGIIRKGCEIHIGGGEFTIYHECNEILELFAINNYARVFVPTNAIKYSHCLFRAMDKATTYIIISLDSGTRKTYKKIKRVDAFNQVMESLEKYAATQKSRDAIRLKYILVPTYNDNIAEFKKFLGIAKKFGITNLIIDIDERYLHLKRYNADGYYINLAKKMNDIAIEQNFITEFYCFYNQSTNNKQFKEDNFIIRFFKAIKYRYFDKKLRELYRNHRYAPK